MALSSNDLLADRRFAWAASLTTSGDHVAAADLLNQAMDRVPAWAPGWAALAEARERAGDVAGARAAWLTAETLDPAETLGATLHLARLDGRTPDTMPESFVRGLFDDYAPRFDRHLKEVLHYRGPGLLAAGLDRAAPGRRFARALDLGCGTGLMGVALADRAGQIDGIDLSPAMVEQARLTGLYGTLTVGSIDATLASIPVGAFDLVVAADVLVYVGDLASVMAGVARALAPGGLFAFTVEGSAEETATACAFALGPDMRFAHAPHYIDAVAAAAGLDVILLEAASIRTGNGGPVPGLLGIATQR